MIEIKQGDTRHAIQAILKDVNGSVVDLSQATVKFVMGKRGATVFMADAQQTEVAGEVWYVFNPGETDVPGFYSCEFAVTYVDGKSEIFPHKGSIPLRINQKLGGI